MPVRGYWFHRPWPTPWIIIWYHLTLQFWCIDSQFPGYDIEVPSSPVRAQRGLCAHIPCYFIIPADKSLTPYATGFWCKDTPCSANTAIASKTGNGANSNRRLLMTGDVSKGDCTLSINNVQQNDGGRYQFRVEDNVRFNYGKTVSIQVTALTDKPVISPMGSLIAGKEVTLTCTSPGRCAGTPPIITWERPSALNNVIIQEGSVGYGDGNKTFHSNLTLTPTRKSNDVLLTCDVSFTNGGPSTSSNVRLNVEYPPEVNISITGRAVEEKKGSFAVKEGEDVVLICTVDGNPASNITWEKGGLTINGTSEALTYNLPSVSPNATGVYTCTAQNTWGTGSKSINIVVKYGPRTPRICNASGCVSDGTPNVYAQEASSLTLLCSAESVPPADLSWITPNKDIIPRGQLTLTHVSFSDEGNYTCRANNTYSESTRNITVVMTYKPKMVEGKTSSCLKTQNLIECSCVSQSFPPANLQWIVNARYYNSTYKSENLDINVEQRAAVTNSTLRLKVTNGEKYTILCRSINAIGALDLQLFKEEEYGSSSVTVAIVSVVVVVLLLITAGLLLKFFRKRKQIEKPESMQDSTVNGSEAIYCNTTPETEINFQKQPADQESAADDGSVYMNYEKELQYATLDFSKMKPRIKAEPEEIEYSEIKRPQKSNTTTE